MTEQEEMKAWEFPPLDDTAPADDSIPEEIFAEPEPSGFTPLSHALEGQPHKSLEEIQQEAYEKAYQEGLKQGHQEAFQKTTQELTQQLQQEWQEKFQQLEQIQALLEKPLKIIDENLESVLVELVRTLLARLIAREVAQAPEILAQLIGKAKDDVLQGKHIKIYLHPNEVESLKTVLPEPNINAHYFPDEHVKPGDFRIETDTTLIRAYFEERINLLLGLDHGP